MLALYCSIVVEGKSLYFSVYSSKLVAVELKAKSGILPVEYNGEFAIQGNDTLYLTQRGLTLLCRCCIIKKAGLAITASPVLFSLLTFKPK